MADTTPTTPATTTDKKDDKKKDGNMIGEIIAAAGAAIGGFLLAAFAKTKGMTVSEIEADVSGFIEDVQFGVRHWGVILASRIVWFWRVCIWLVLGHLIFDGWFGNGLFLATWKSILFYCLFEAGHAVLQFYYAWPVKNVGAFDHRKRRLVVDEARRKVKELENLQEKNDPTFDAGKLFSAQTDLDTKEPAYQEWVVEQGATDRSPLFVIITGCLLSLCSGMTLLYGVIGRHDGGPYTRDQVVSYVEDICILPYPLFLGPLFILIITLPFVFNRISSIEDFLTFVRLSAKAAATIGKGLPEVEKEHLAAAKDNGDQPHRNATKVALQHVMEALAVIGMKVMAAMGLLVHWCLFYPSWTAFKLGAYFGTFFFFLRVFKEKINILQEHQVATKRVQTASFLTVIAIYVHYYFAGGASPANRGIGWWISDEGPFGTTFGSDSQHTANAVSAGADAVAQPTVNYGSHLLGMSGTGVLVFVVLGLITLAALYAVWTPTFNIIKAQEKDKAPLIVKRIAATVFIGVSGLISAAVIAYLFRAPLHVEQNADVVRTTTRPAATQTVPSAPGASTAFDSDTRRRCAFNTLNQPPCEPTCYQFHGWADSRANIEAGARNGTCYVVPWYSVGNSASR